jgi:hypothetical protein
MLCALSGAALAGEEDDLAGSGGMNAWHFDEASMLMLPAAMSFPDVRDRAPIACDESGLANGRQLPEAPELYTRWNPDRSYGAFELIDTLGDAARAVATALPNADPIVIGDMSQKGGGWISGHRTHQGGRDADIGLFVGDHRQPLAGAFVDVPPQALDVEATWLLIESLLDSGQVQFILLDAGLITTLRAYVLEHHRVEAHEAERIFPAGPVPFSEPGVVHAAAGHRNHMHVRVTCDADGLQPTGS